MSEFERHLNRTCTIQAPQSSQSGTGEIVKAWTPSATGVPTRKRRPSRERIIDGQYQVTLEDWVFSFLPGVAIGKENRIVDDEGTYDVLSVKLDSARHHQTAYARERSHE